MKEFNTITKCKICGSEDFKFHYEILINNDLTINKLLQKEIPKTWLCKCPVCNFGFSNPQIIENSLNSYYANNSVFYDKGFDIPIDKITRENKKLLEYIFKAKRSGNILEIGCGLGFLLNEFNNKDWNRFGVEPSPFACDYARNKLGLNVYHGFLKNNLFDNDFFDVIMLFDVLEHIADPVDMVQKIYKILNKGGMLVIGTGNIDSFNARITKGYWPYLNTWEHISFFSPKSIRFLLDLNGYLEIDVHRLSHQGSFFENLIVAGKCVFKNSIKLIIRPIKKYTLSIPLMMDHMIVTALK